MLFSTAFFISGNMRQSILIVLFFLYCETTLAQGTLRLSSKELFQLTESSISLDSLIMADSSAILLPNHKATLIRTNYAWFGNYCVLDGAGVSGEDGFGTSIGTGGTIGISLVLYFKAIEIGDQLIINLSGGNGGKPGKDVKSQEDQFRINRNSQEF